MSVNWQCGFCQTPLQNPLASDLWSLLSRYSSKCFSSSAFFAISCLCIAFARASVAIISIWINSYDWHARSARSKRDKNIHLEPDELPLRSRRRARYRLSASDPVLGWVGFKSELVGERRGDGRFRGRLPVTWLGFCRR